MKQTEQQFEHPPLKDGLATSYMLFTELFGTFIIVYFSGLAAIQFNLGIITLTGSAISNAFCLGIMVYAGANISGAHYNSSVTIAQCISGHIDWYKALWYLFFQFMGSIIAGGLLTYYEKSYLPLEGLSITLDYPHCNLQQYTIFMCFLTEFIGTFIYIFIVYMTNINRTKPYSDIYGMAIGGGLGLSILSIGNITGSALNPWRVIGPAIVSGELFDSEYSYAYVYYIGCTLSGIAFGLLWRCLLLEKDEKVVVKEEEQNLLNDDNLD